MELVTDAMDMDMTKTDSCVPPVMERERTAASHVAGEVTRTVTYAMAKGKLNAQDAMGMANFVADDVREMPR